MVYNAWRGQKKLEVRPWYPWFPEYARTEKSSSDMNTTLFETKPPCPPVKFEYPEFWKIVPSSGKVYKDVKLIGPRNADDAFSAALVVRFTQLVIPGMGLERVVEDSVARKSKLPGFMITSRSSLELTQHEAESIEFSYSILKSLEKLGHGQMKICEKRILFFDGNTQCEIIYSATEDD